MPISLRPKGDGARRLPDRSAFGNFYSAAESSGIARNSMPVSVIDAPELFAATGETENELFAEQCKR